MSPWAWLKWLITPRQRTTGTTHYEWAKGGWVRVTIEADSRETFERFHLWMNRKSGSPMRDPFKDLDPNGMPDWDAFMKQMKERR